ncbi:MAG: hypothetical protein WD851_10945 [Pirellulales bacterium]
MRLLFVADGPRDCATVPELVQAIVKAPIAPVFREWKKLRLSRGSGYQRKLQFALLQARELELAGVVATIDSDKSPAGDGLMKLRSARDQDRKSTRVAQIPAAVGEAIPHLEAWLLDDPKAVREALHFPSDKLIPPVSKTEPKNTLNVLIDESARSEGMMDLLAEIARCIDKGRCNHSDKTGFESFVQDVRAELEPLVSIAS